MTDSMVERVARAIAKGRGLDPEADLSYGKKPSWQYFTDDARAAIAAMRMPTDGMIEDGLGLTFWQTMIDEALK